MKVPYLDLSAQHTALRPELDLAVREVVDSNDFVNGRAARRFEEQFAEYCGVAHCVGVNNGTMALVLALRALGVGDADEVITAANTFIATIEAIALTGAKPVLVDVDAGSKTIDPALIEAAITPRTRAIIPVHLYGTIANMAAIGKLASKHGLPVLEDAAQAQGAKRDGKKAGNFADIAGFSFYPGKNIGAWGDAGAVTTSNPELAETVRLLTDHGSPKKFHHEAIGYNARLNGLQAAVLRVKLPYLDGWNARRREIAEMYNARLVNSGLELPDIDSDGGQVFHVYVVGADHRDRLQSALTERGIPTNIHYPIPPHLQPAFEYLGYRRGDFPVTERLAERVLSLPIFPEMTNEQIELVCHEVEAALGDLG